MNYPLFFATSLHFTFYVHQTHCFSVSRSIQPCLLLVLVGSSGTADSAVTKCCRLPNAVVQFEYIIFCNLSHDVANIVIRRWTAEKVRITTTTVPPHLKSVAVLPLSCNIWMFNSANLLHVIQCKSCKYDAESFIVQYLSTKYAKFCFICLRELIYDVTACVKIVCP